MEIQINQILKDLEGNDIKATNDQNEEQSLTLKDVVIKSLITTFNDENIDGNEKFSRYETTMKIKKSEITVDLTLEELILIKKLIGKMWGVVIVGQAYNLLEKKNK